MYPVSAAYKTAIGQNVRDVRITGTITLKDNSVINITDEDIVQGSLYITEQCVAGEDIEVGNVYASEMGLSLSMPLENPYSLDGARIIINFGINVETDPDKPPIWEYVPLGYFYVTEIQRKANNVNLTALDGMLLFDIPVGDPGSSSPRNFVVYACEQAGVPLGTSVFEIDTFANAGVLLAAPDTSKIKTCRDLLMWACQIMGAFARINRQGELEIVPIKARTSVKTINKAQRFSSDVSDFQVKITKVAMTVGGTEYAQGVDGMTMVLEENPLLSGKTESEINTILTNLLNQITQAEYIPCNVMIAGDPALQAGDRVTLTGIKMFNKLQATFIRSSAAYKSDGTQVAANIPRFETGKFGQAVMVEEGTTNLAINPLFENPLSEWMGSPSMSYSSRITDTPFGERPVLVVNGAAYDYTVICANYDFTPLPGSDAPVTVSLWMRNLGSDEGVPGFYLGTWYKSTDKILKADGNWYRISRTFQPGEYEQNGRFHFYKGVIGEVEVCAIQVEYGKPYPTSFVDGTRAAETLTIPTEGIMDDISSWSIEFWGKQAIVTNRIQGWFEGRWTSGIPVLIILNASKQILVYCLDEAGNNSLVFIGPTISTPGDWHYYAITYSAGVMKIYFDGAKIGEVSTTLKTNSGTNPFRLGYDAGSSPHEGNVLIDELRISSRARTDEEIAASYQSGLPLPVDEWTTTKIAFDGSLAAVTTVGDSIITHSTWRYRGPHNIKGAGKHGLVRGVQNQQMKAVSSIMAIARAAQDLALAANQSTQLIKDAIGGHVLIRQNPDETNEILIMDNPDPDQAVKIWRWNMGGLGYSDNCVGADNPDREYEIAMTMDGAINANFIKTGQLDAGVVRIGPETTFAPGYDPSQIEGASAVGMGVDSDCTGLWHFDGTLNSHKGVSATFTRASVAYLEDGTQVPAEQPRFEPGKFGKGVLIEEGTTNLISNPDFEVDTAGWFTWQTSIERVTTEKWSGNASLKVTLTGTEGAASTNVALSSPVAGTVYTGSCYVKGAPGKIARLLLRLSGGANATSDLYSPTITCDGTWQRIIFSRAIDYSDRTTISLAFNSYGNAVGDIYYVDGFQLEQKPYATSFIDGTRSPETLTIPTAGVLNPQEGMVGCWIYFDANALATSRGNYWIFGTTKTGYGDRLILQRLGTNIGFQVSNDTTTTVISFPCSDINVGWHYLAARWTTSEIALFLDGVKKATASNPNLPPSLASSCGIGYNIVEGSEQCNTLIDELRIDKIARTDEEIAGWYKANAPFYTSEDMKQWPGYMKLETDGLKVYDPNDALRVLVGSWLKDAVRKYGAKIIEGEIYSTLIRSGEEGSTTYVELNPTGNFRIVNNGITILETMTDVIQGGSMYFSRNNGDAFGLLSYYADTYPGFALEGKTGGSSGPLTLRGSTVKVLGDFEVAVGSKFCIQETNYGRLRIHARESPEIRFVDEGMGTLIDGECRIDVDPIFLECIEPHTPDSRWYVNLTPYGKAILYVDEIGDGYFVVKDYNGNANGIEFTWSLSATRKDYALIRFMEVLD